MNLKVVCAAFAVFAVGACASTPEEVVDTQPVARETGPMAGSVEDFRRAANDSVFFAFDSFALTSESQATLRAQAAWLQANPGVNVRIEGNCDERGTPEYNIALGQRRSNAAREFLVGLGVSPSRILATSNGKEKPRASGSNEAAWRQNRNSQTIIVSGAAS